MGQVQFGYGQGTRPVTGKQPGDCWQPLCCVLMKGCRYTSLTCHAGVSAGYPLP